MFFVLQIVILFHLCICEIQSLDLKAEFYKAIHVNCDTIPLLDITNIKTKESLGSGAAGSVHLVEYQGTTYALKKIQIKKKEYAMYAAEEVCKMHNMKNASHVVKVFGAGFDDTEEIPYAFLTMDVYDGNLQNLAARNYDDLKAGVTSFGTSHWRYWLRRVLYQVSLGTKEMHDNHLLHLDIKPDNFLVRSPLHTHIDGFLVPKVVLSDLGTSRNLTSLGNERLASRPTGTYEYMAPEIIRPFLNAIHDLYKSLGETTDILNMYENGSEDERSFINNTMLNAAQRTIYPTYKSDIYSLGVTFHLLSTRTLPFTVVHGGRVARLLSIYDFHGANCSGIDEKLCELIHWMMEQEPANRPSIHQVLDHEFFRAVNRKHRNKLRHKKNKRD